MAAAALIMREPLFSSHASALRGEREPHGANVWGTGDGTCEVRAKRWPRCVCGLWAVPVTAQAWWPVTETLCSVHGEQI